jgi:hypothetical protein
MRTYMRSTLTALLVLGATGLGLGCEDDPPSADETSGDEDTLADEADEAVDEAADDTEEAVDETAEEIDEEL